MSARVTIILTLQRFPGSLLPPSPNATSQTRNELQRRKKYVALLEAHIGGILPTLVELVKECLSDAAHQRPGTDDLLDRLQRMRKEVEGEYSVGIVSLDLSRLRLAKELRRKDKLLQEQKVRFKQTIPIAHKN